MPKQAQSHQGAPREYPEKNGPRGLAVCFLEEVLLMKLTTQSRTGIKPAISIADLLKGL